MKSTVLQIASGRVRDECYLASTILSAREVAWGARYLVCNRSERKLLLQGEFYQGFGRLSGQALLAPNAFWLPVKVLNPVT